MREKALSLLGLMRRANAVDVGEENTGCAVRGGRAKLLLTACDASENARKRAEGFAAGRNVTAVELPFEKAELSAALGLPGCSMAAVTDLGFADALMKILSELDESYGAPAEEIRLRLERTEHRRKDSGTRDRTKRIGKRRTKA